MSSSNGFSTSFTPPIRRSVRKRNVLTVELKLKVIERLERGETPAKLAAEYGVGIQTVRDMLTKKEQLLRFACNSETISSLFTRKTMMKSRFHALDEALYSWYKQQRAQGRAMSVNILIETAQRFHREMCIAEPFQASHGWLKRFRCRHGIEYLEDGSEDRWTPDEANTSMESPQEGYQMFEKVDVDGNPPEECKENTMREIQAMQEKVKAATMAMEGETYIDPTLASMDKCPEMQDPCSTDSLDAIGSSTRHVPVERYEQFVKFGELVTHEMRVLKNPHIIRQLKMNILKNIYEAQADDENN